MMWLPPRIAGSQGAMWALCGGTLAFWMPAVGAQRAQLDSLRQGGTD